MKTKPYKELFSNPTKNIVGEGMEPNSNLPTDASSVSPSESKIAKYSDEIVAPTLDWCGREIHPDLFRLALMAEGAKSNDVKKSFKEQKKVVQDLVGVLKDRKMSVTEIANILGESYYNVYQRYNMHVDQESVRKCIEAYSNISTEEVVQMLRDAYAFETSLHVVAEFNKAEILDEGNRLYSNGLANRLDISVAGGLREGALKPLSPRPPKQKLDLSK